MGMASIAATLPSRARKLTLVALSVLAAAALSGCSISSEASRTLELDANSEKAIVVLGTTIDRNHAALPEEWYDRPNLLITHWQKYDPASMELIVDETLVMSLREDTIWSEETLRDPAVHVLEVEPGDYALIGVTLFQAITTFVPLTGSNFERHTNTLFPMASDIEMKGKVEAKRNFLFSVKSGQVIYIGHFDFVHLGGGQKRIVDVDYWQDEMAARAALKDYPGILSDMIPLNLMLPTETAAR